MTFQFVAQYTFIFYFFFLLNNVFAQTYDFVDVGDEYQLESKYIYDIESDQHQQLLLSTEHGLVVFDGLHFDLISIKGRSNDDILIDIFFDGIRTYYLGYYDGVIISTKDFRDFEKVGDSQFGKIQKFSSDTDGVTYVLIQNKGLLRIMGETLEEVEFPTPIQEILDFEVTENGLVVSTDEGLRFFNKDFKEIYNGLNDAKGGYSLYKSKDYLFLHNQKGMGYVVEQNSVAEIKSNLDFSFVKSEIEDLFFTENVLWISTKNSGIYKVGFSDESLQSYNVRSYDVKNGLLENQTKSLFVDNHSQLWVGYYGYGISKLKSENIVLLESIGGTEMSEFSAISYNNKGNILLGTENGLYEIDFQKDTIKKVLDIEEAITAVQVTSDDLVWVGTENNGIIKIEDDVASRIREVNQVKLPKINGVHVGDGGNAYFATDIGLVYYSVSKKEFIQITSNEGLVHNVINYLLEDADGTLWFAPEGASLFSYQNQSFTIHKDITDLSQFNLKTLLDLPSEGLVVGTESDGVFILKEDEKVVHKKTKDGLLHNTVYGLLQNDKHLWVFHKRGITVLDEKYQVVRYYREDEIFNAELKSNAMFQDPTGLFWIGSNKGLIKLDPSISNSAEPPEIMFEGFSVNTEFFNDLELEYKYGKYSFFFDFKSVTLTAPEKITYRYKLEGFEDEWHELPYNNSQTVYSKLYEGEYRFLVKAVNEDGLESKIIYKEFIIDDPFWKKLWFVIFLPLVIIGIVYLIIQWRLKTIKEQKIVLERTVHQRTVELRKERDNLNDAKLQIEHKNKEITDSINYAERIQKALLPQVEKGKLPIKDLFILYKPCDIVSGDFYWLGKKKEKTIIAVADCTGHGVPGAFMSMISATLLDKIVMDNNITTSREIVERLDKDLIHSLRSKGGESKDGIDIGIIVINHKKNIIDYCGASRPLYLIKENKLEVFKGGMLSIGEFSDVLKKEYVSHEIEIQLRMKIYVSSDGYPDQFGGPKNRKFMVGKFKKLLLDSNKISFDKHHQVLSDNFENWKGSYPQTDDVLVVGIEF